jgi:S1-C subfamily serine protease
MGTCGRTAQGVVSQIRDDYKWSYEDGSKHEAKVLQLQTAINPGNSGGPVVDDSGKILGLVAMSEEGQNLDYAIAADVIKRFLFTGLQMTARGMAKVMPDSKPPQQLFVAKLADSTPVSKAVYADFVMYSIDGKDSGLVAKFSDGTEIKAWNPDSRGSFKSWSAKLSNGKRFAAVASNGSVTQISALQ